MTPLYAACTIAAPNYLAHAKVLASSLGRFHPDMPLFVLVPGARGLQDGRAFSSSPNVRLLDVGDLSLPGRRRLAIRYGTRQLCAALKPVLLTHLLEQGIETVVFLDPDMLVTAELGPLLEGTRRHSLTLTPHIDGSVHLPGPVFERELLLTGIYNAGCLGVSNRNDTVRFLGWWGNRLRTYCLEEIRQGIHYDQRWLDLAPGFVEDCWVLCDPGVNAGWWRLPFYDWVSSGDGFLIGGTKLRLFHASGYDPARPEQVTRYHPHWRVESLGGARTLFETYQRLLVEAGWNRYSSLPSLRPDGWQPLFDMYHRLLLQAGRNGSKGLGGVWSTGRVVYRSAAAWAQWARGSFTGCKRR